MAGPVIVAKGLIQKNNYTRIWGRSRGDTTPRANTQSLRRTRRPIERDFHYAWRALFGAESAKDERTLDVVDRRRGTDRGGAPDRNLLPARHRHGGRLRRGCRVAGGKRAQPVADGERPGR